MNEILLEQVKRVIELLQTINIIMLIQIKGSDKNLFFSFVFLGK